MISYCQTLMPLVKRGRRVGLAVGGCCLALVLSLEGLAAEREVGTASTVVRDITGILNQNVREVQLNDRVYFEETIESGEESATEIKFQDGTTLRMGPLSRITLNRVVFDPDASKSSFAASLEQGVFEITSGALSKDKYKFETPTGTIGIRGTRFTVVVMSPEVRQWLELSGR